MVDWDVQDIFNRFNLHIGTTENVGRIDLLYSIGTSHFTHSSHARMLVDGGFCN